MIEIIASSCLSLDPSFIVPNSGPSGVDEDLELKDSSTDDSAFEESTGVDNDEASSETESGGEEFDDSASATGRGNTTIEDTAGTTGTEETTSAEGGTEFGGEPEDTASSGETTETGAATTGLDATGTDTTDTGATGGTEESAAGDSTTTGTGTSESGDTGAESCVPEICYSLNTSVPVGSGAPAENYIHAAPLSFSRDQYIVRVEFPTGLIAGTTTLEVWDNSGQYPRNRLGGTDLKVSSTISWEGTDFNPGVPVTAGLKYWLLWYPLQGMKLPIGDTGQAVLWRWSTNLVSPFWVGADSSPWIYKVYCCDTPN